MCIGHFDVLWFYLSTKSCIVSLFLACRFFLLLYYHSKSCCSLSIRLSYRSLTTLFLSKFVFIVSVENSYSYFISVNVIFIRLLFYLKDYPLVIPLWLQYMKYLPFTRVFLSYFPFFVVTLLWQIICLVLFVTDVSIGISTDQIP